MFRRVALLILLGCGLDATAAQAQDATWVGNGTPTASWNTAANWNPATVPLDIASFNASPSTTVTFSAATTIDTMQFNAGASSYTFNLNGNSLEITAAALGPGIVNNSGVAQTFNTNGGLQFSNTATAGNAVINNTPGTTTFAGFSTSGTATITNSGGGTTTFTDSSTAGSATITTNAGSLTQFLLNSDGANARLITNAGGTVDFSGTSGLDGLNQISAGSIEGAGTYNLGGNRLTVGGNNLSTVVSGTINDGGSSGGSFAFLIKDGTGTMTLSGVNTYSGGTVLNNGTLLMAGAGTLGTSTALLQVLGGTLDLGGTTQTTGAMSIFGGSIINGTLNSASYDLETGLVSALLTGGAATKDGVGTVFLTNANTYAGGTTINAGILDINNGNALSNGAITLNGGTLRASQTFTLNNSLTFANNSTASVSASAGKTLTLGAVAFNDNAIATFGSPTDTGTVVFTSTSVVFGTASVVVAGGTLSAASSALGGALALTQSTTVNAGATLAFNDNVATILNLAGAGSVSIGINPASTLQLRATAGTTQEFSGVISGAGKVEVTTVGSGPDAVMILSGNNTYGGGTEIFASTTLQLGNGGTTGSVLGNIGNAGDLIFNRADAYTFAGNISGAGNLTQAGTGTTILTANNGYTGTTTVNAGALIVDGSIASSSLTTVNAGGTLGGSGTVGTTAIADGTLAPGNPAGNTFGPLTVAGSLTFTAASTYLIQVSPANAGRTNVVGGSATLGGATVAANFLPGSYVNRQYTILNATGGVAGTFNPAVTSNMANIQSTLSYDANNAFLNIKIVFVPPPSGQLSTNQQNVANALTNFFNTTGSIPFAFAALNAAGLTVASGELGTGIIQSVVKADNLFLNMLLDPTLAGRAGGFAPVTGATRFAENDEALAYEKRLATPHERDAYAMATKAPRLLAAAPLQRWSVWGAGYGGSARIGGDPVVLGSHDVTASAWGIAAGADYKVSPDTLLGFALGGGGTNYSLSDNLGRGSSDMFQAGAFGRHNIGPAYISAALAYGWHDVTTNRTVALAGIDQLQARFRAETLSARVEAGYRFATPVVGITPYVAAQSTTVRLPAYVEQAIVGNPQFALNYAGQTTTLPRTELGLRTDRSMAMQDAVLILRGRLAWAHDYNNDRAIAAVFQALPGANFVVNGAKPNADAALVSAGAEVKWLSGFSIAGTFEGEFSGNVTSYAGKGVVRYSW